jgi:WD40 repeat protein
MLATCGSDYAILVWHPLTGDHLRTLRSRGAVSAVAFSPDGTLLASNGGVGGGAQLWNPTTGEHLRVLGAPGPVDDVAFRADGTIVAGGALWLPATGERVLDLDHGEPRTVAVSPDNQLLATATRYSGSGAWNPTVRVWNLTTGEHVRDLVTAPAGMSFQSLAFSPDGQLLAMACDAWVQLSDPATGDHVHRLGGADAVAFHPNGNLLATARSHHWTDAGVRLWNPATGSRVRELNTAANALAFSPDGAYLATGSDADGVVRLWDLTGTSPAVSPG